MSKTKKWFGYFLILVFLLMSGSLVQNIFSSSPYPNMNEEESNFAHQALNQLIDNKVDGEEIPKSFSASESDLNLYLDFLKQNVDLSKTPKPIAVIKDAKVKTLSMEYALKDTKSVLVDVTTELTSGRGNTIAGIAYFPLDVPVENHNWSFQTKSLLHKAVLFFGFSMFLINAYLSYLVFLKANSKYGAFCFFFSLWGAPTLVFNWTTGASKLLLAQFVVLSFGLIKLPWYSYWSIQASLPIGGALALYLVTRRNRKIKI